MPNFAASLLNSDSQDDLVLNSAGTTITIGDNSNYLTSDETGHLAASFTLYRKITVTDDNGSTYTFSSVDTAVSGSIEVILPGNSGTNSFVDTPEAGDSLYTVRLITIPTWNSGVTYLLSNGVYVARTVSGVVKIYKLLVSSSLNQVPETITASWVEITDVTTVSTKYNVLGYLAVVRTIEEAQAEAVEEAVDLFITETFFTPLANEFWVSAKFLQMIIKSVTNDLSQGLHERVSWLIARGKDLIGKKRDTVANIGSRLGHLWWVKDATLDMIVQSVANNMSSGNYAKVSVRIAQGKVVAAIDPE